MPLTLEDLSVLAHHVLVEPLGEPEKTGSFFLPDSSVGTDQSRGLVVAVGNGEVLPSGTVRELGVEKDDLVFYSKYAGFPLTIGGREYQLIPETSIAMRVAAATEPISERDLDTGEEREGVPLVVRAQNGKLYLDDEVPPPVEGTPATSLTDINAALPKL